MEPATLTVPDEARLADCFAALQALRTPDHFGGLMRLDAACRVCVEHGLGDNDAIQCIRAWTNNRPLPKELDDRQVIFRLRVADKQVVRGGVYGATRPPQPPAQKSDPSKPEFRSVRQLMLQFPSLRPPLIHGLLRLGETMNVIAPPKTGKSWLVTDLALSVATGRPWLGVYQVEPGKVLIIDNELHGETSAHRIPKVAEARGICLDDVSEEVFVENLRGRLRDLMTLGPYFKALEPGRFKLIVLDAFYRFIPKDTDENDNGSVAQLYNYLDSYALELGCSFVLIHHSTKGNQSAKAVTDVGAGAGSQSRATDTHLILRAHEEPDAVALDAAVRSWPKVTPLCLKWSFPVWNPALDLDPEALKPERAGRRRGKAEDEPSKPAEPPWDAARFVREFIRPEARTRAAVIEDAVRAGLSERRAERLLLRAEDMGLAHRWKFDSNAPVKYATVSQPLMDVGMTPKLAKKRRRKK